VLTAARNLTVSFVFVLSSFNPFNLRLGAQLDRPGRSSVPGANGGGPILWQDPIDIESRDLFFGPGGAEGAPNPSDRFAFIERKGSALDTSEKIIVRDDKGRTWTAKFGPEARAEVAASRIVWAAGYHVDQDYFLERAHIEGRGGFEVRDIRFERNDDGLKKTGQWSWTSNPFAGTRALQGLKVLMALINNWDLSKVNNKIAHDEANQRTVYYVSDLGASFGRTGSWLNRIPIYKDAAVPGSRGDANAFADLEFIKTVTNGEVVFNWQRKFGRDALRGVTVENARWIGGLLGRLSDKQLSDAFRAAGFDDHEIATYVSSVRKRIRQLQTLEQTEPVPKAS